MGRKKTKKREASGDVDIEMVMKKPLLSSGHQSTPEDIFKSLLQGSNLTLSEFFAKYWEQKPLIISREQRKTKDNNYSEYCSLAILKQILNENDLKFVHDLNVCRYVDGRREDLNGKGVVKVGKLESLISKKNATVQFHQPQRFQDSLWKICSSLECYFQCLVGANVYITPGGSQGLAPHYDDVEVFILQLEGEKHWRLYELPEEERLPRNYSRDLDPASLNTPTHDFVLKV
ncbi:ribosomal oxygenase 2-like isoform X1 [Anneissia japonica]|uniref:ribosomal oxygenase 2-like isoform X1 n=1 Tax=Anneissia japonica TaxID=1529436 RepID=UPI00142581EA|nr:ribosomal oxygenase 2-like isoform X1 [Anneissia japonica]